MASLPIEERLLHYFLAMGAEPAEHIQEAPEGLTLVLGSERIHIAILKNDAFLERGKIVGSIMSLASLRDSVNQLYLAAPRLLGTTVEAGIFRSHGIGLLLFDDRRIEETVTPQSFQPRQAKAGSYNPDQALVTEIETLKSMYSEMERNLTSLQDEVRNYQEKMASMTASRETFSLPPVLRQEPTYVPQSSGLPSFFSNNPWLEVLSKRGKEEVPSIAG